MTRVSDRLMGYAQRVPLPVWIMVDVLGLAYLFGAL